jgi:hypothetical protein
MGSAWGTWGPSRVCHSDWGRNPRLGPMVEYVVSLDASLLAGLA